MKKYSGMYKSTERNRNKMPEEIKKLILKIKDTKPIPPVNLYEERVKLLNLMLYDKCDIKTE